MGARLNNNLLGLATIKAFATEGFEADHIEQASNAYRSANRQAIRISSAITPMPSHRLPMRRFSLGAC